MAKSKKTATKKSSPSVKLPPVGGGLSGAILDGTTYMASGKKQKKNDKLKKKGSKTSY